MTWKYFNLIFILFFGYCNVLSAQQINFKENEVFFNAQKVAIVEWLDLAINRDKQVLSFDSINIYENEIAVYLSVPGKKSWNSLIELSDSVYNRDFCSYLFRDLAFLLQPPDLLSDVELEDNLTIWVLAEDLQFSIFQNVENGEVENLEIFSMGTIKDSLNVVLNKLYLFPKMDSLKLDSSLVNKLKTHLVRNLQSFFEHEDQKTYGFIRGKSEVKNSNLRFSNRFSLDVKNIKGMIFPQASTWEYLCIDFTFKNKKISLQLEYTIKAKYYDGGIFRPANIITYGDKEDIEELGVFNEELKQIILETLKSNNE